MKLTSQDRLFINSRLNVIPR